MSCQFHLNFRQRFISTGGYEALSVLPPLWKKLDFRGRSSSNY